MDQTTKLRPPLLLTNYSTVVSPLLLLRAASVPFLFMTSMRTTSGGPRQDRPETEPGGPRFQRGLIWTYVRSVSDFRFCPYANLGLSAYDNRTYRTFVLVPVLQQYMVRASVPTVFSFVDAHNA